jgi:uncharacterized protein (DUF488 family)
MSTLYTICHSTQTVAEFVALLQPVDVELIVDVRSIPRSRTDPQFNMDTLPASLSAAGMAYRHLSALGGRRHRRPDQLPSPNTLWRNQSFRNYADYAATDEFRVGLDELRGHIRECCCALMCAEAVWWRCHRRIIADYLLSEGISVVHIMGSHKIQLATLTPVHDAPRAGCRRPLIRRPWKIASASILVECPERGTDRSSPRLRAVRTDPTHWP